MRLLTHNMLHSAHKRGVEKGYPLLIEVLKSEIVKQPINVPFLKSRLAQLDWDCFVVGCKAVGVEGMPSQFSVSLLDDADFLALCHHALMEIHVIEGHLVCAESARKFPIKDGIPNMLLLEDELPFVTDNENKADDVEVDANENEPELKTETVSDSKNDDTKTVTADNPYVDASLMESLETFSPKANEQFMASRVVPTQPDTKQSDAAEK